MRWACLLLATILATSPVAFARDLYVNNRTGDDRSDGSSREAIAPGRGPFRTIARALRAADGGDQIFIENTGTPYRESLTLQAARHSGSPGQPFVIYGNNAVLDGSMPVPAEAWESYEGDIYRFRAEKKSFHLLYLAGRPAKRVTVEDPKARVPALKPLEWCLFEGYVYFHTELGKLPQHYDLTHTVLPVGVTLYEVRHVLIQELIVQGFQLDGVNAHDGVTDTQLVGLVCRGNGRSGISVGGASRVSIEACLVGDNGAAQVRTEGFSHTRLRNCDLIDRPFAPALVREGGEVTIENRTADSRADEMPTVKR